MKLIEKLQWGESETEEVGRPERAEQEQGSPQGRNLKHVQAPEGQRSTDYEQFPGLAPKQLKLRLFPFLLKVGVAMRVSSSEGSWR